MGGRAGRGERIGGRVARAPGCGRCLELLTPAAWLPPASQSSNKRGRRRGRRRSQESRRLHSLADPGRARDSLGASSQWGWGRARGSVPLGDTLLSYRHALSAGLWDTGLPPASPSRPSRVWAPRGTGEPLQVSRECPPCIPVW